MPLSTLSSGLVRRGQARSSPCTSIQGEQEVSAQWNSAYQVVLKDPAIASIQLDQLCRTFPAQLASRRGMQLLLSCYNGPILPLLLFLQQFALQDFRPRSINVDHERNMLALPPNRRVIGNLRLKQFFSSSRCFLFTTFLMKTLCKKQRCFQRFRMKRP